MAKRTWKTIYRLQHEHSMPASYYATRKEADGAWEESPEPLEYMPVDAVAECESLTEQLEKARGEIDGLVFALTELMAITPTEVLATRHEAQRALEVIRRYDPGVAEYCDRDLADLKERKKAEGK